MKANGSYKTVRDRGTAPRTVRQARKLDGGPKFLGGLLTTIFGKITWVASRPKMARRGASQSAGVRIHVASRRMWL
jgi:hypothetical protein